MLHPVVPTLERHVVLGEQAAQGLHALLEPVHPLGGRRERDAELAMLRLVPRGADRALDAPVRQVVDGDDLRGEHRRMAVRHAGDERAEPHARGLAREPGQQRPRLERRPLRVRVERLEVVEDPDAVETRPPRRAWRARRGRPR